MHSYFNLAILKSCAALEFGSVLTETLRLSSLIFLPWYPCTEMNNLSINWEDLENFYCPL